MSKRRKPQPTRSRWQPLEPAATATDAEQYAAHGLTAPDAVYVNDLYSVFVRKIGHGAMHISFHRHDRAAVRDWRHLQAIKNEVAGPERLAIELFPPESQLVDSANEYHLWVLPKAVQDDFPFLLRGSPLVQTQEEGEAILGPSRMRQRSWQPGIPTGRGAAS